MNILKLPIRDSSANTLEPKSKPESNAYRNNFQNTTDNPTNTPHHLNPNYQKKSQKHITQFRSLSPPNSPHKSEPDLHPFSRDLYTGPDSPRAFEGVACHPLHEDGASSRGPQITGTLKASEIDGPGG